jgi:peroxidase
MSRKPFLLTAAFFIVASVSFMNGIAQPGIPVQRRPFIFQPRTILTSQRPPIHLRIHPPFRSYDGRNNNISSGRELWGSADIPFLRELPAFYGSSDPNNAMGGALRPSAREISNAVIDEPVTQFNTRHLSTLVYQWGQFLDHELDLTPTGTTEYVPVQLPPDEVIFTEEIPFYRSEVRAGTGINSPRQQSNLNTAWIDGSVVYGSDETRANWLRTFTNGKMKTSVGNFLPYNTTTGEESGSIDITAPDMANDDGKTVKTFVAGDVRAAENPVLLSIHTLFVREHNRICDSLFSIGLRNDELMYQIARKVVGALIQGITYQEFLPSLGLSLSPYEGYKDFIKPDIANTFATASYRIGHTMVSDDVILADNDCEEVGPGEMDLVDVFWNPQLVRDFSIDVFLKGASSHDQYETDTKINSVLRNFLFVSANDPVRFGIDLGSLNIQRGRDHGLPDYNTARLFYTGRAAKKFSDITSNTGLASQLKRLYGTPNNIDLWIGILAEDHLPNKSVGITMNAMLNNQFERLRNGDFYFYLNDPFLTDNIRRQVKNTTFSDVIKRNTTLTNIAANVFRTDSCHTEEEVKAAAQKPESIPANDITFNLYPNPVTDVLNIQVPEAAGLYSIKIFSTDGILVKVLTAGSGKTIQVNTSHFTSGMYVVNIITGKELKSFKFVKL